MGDGSITGTCILHQAAAIGVPHWRTVRPSTRHGSTTSRSASNRKRRLGFTE